MKEGKSGSSFSCSSLRIPSSALLSLCCILNRRTCIKHKENYGKLTQFLTTQEILKDFASSFVNGFCVYAKTTNW